MREWVSVGTASFTLHRYGGFVPRIHEVGGKLGRDSVDDRRKIRELSRVSHALDVTWHNRHQGSRNRSVVCPHPAISEKMERDRAWDGVAAERFRIPSSSSEQSAVNSEQFAPT